MAQVCTVCQHVEHGTINAALHSGVPTLTVLAERYDLSRFALSRHRDAHMSKAWAGLTPEEVAATTDVLDIDAELRGLLEDLRLARATAVNRETGYVNIPHLDKVAGRITQVVELVAKLERRLGPSTVVDARSVTVNLAQSAEWHEVRGALVEALRPFPDALDAVGRALGELEAGEVVEVEAVTS